MTIYYVEDNAHRNDEGARTKNSRQEAEEFENCTDNVEGMEHVVEEFSASHGEYGQIDSSMQKERPKRRKRKCYEKEVPRTRRKVKEQANALSMQCETVKEGNTQSEVAIVDIGRFSEVSKKIIVNHVMGCDNLVEVMKSIFAFAKQILG